VSVCRSSPGLLRPTAVDEKPVLMCVRVRVRSQATVFYASATAPEDAEMRRRAPMLLCGSILMVLLQCACVAGVAVGLALPSCSSSYQCMGGMYCRVNSKTAQDSLPSYLDSRCQYCGSVVPLPFQIDGECTFDDEGTRTLENPACRTLNWWGDVKSFDGYNSTLVSEVCAEPSDRLGIEGLGKETFFPASQVATWCARCVHPLDKTVDPLISKTRIKDNVDRMSKADWTTLLFATFVVAFSVVGELKDIELCHIAMIQAGDALSPRMLFALRLLGGLRRWTFLAILVTLIPALVVLEGGDALSVCFNTVAMLFLCEIDNICFRVGLSERVRSRVESVGRVELGDAEAAALARSKLVHVSVIVFCTLATVGSVALLFGEAASPATTATVWSFWIAGVLEEAIAPDATSSDKVRRACAVTVSWLLGLAAAVCFLFLSFLT
jgi:hypothetical protein